jgi:acyl-coenzyme A synthetase/AMP-(fatty) acid ligase
LPGEVETVLFEHPDVADCLVYAMSHILTGQAVAAEIVEVGDVDSKELKRSIKRYCRERLDAYKCPAKIVLCDATTFSDRFKKMRRREKA